jgi:glycosyltransferase involved in cell wall biosynthesis
MLSHTKKLLRIGIDARFYGPVGKGLGRYVQEVVDNVLLINQDNGDEFEFVVFLGPDNFDQFTCPSSSVFKRKISLFWYSWREQLFFPFIIKKEKIDLMHYPHFNVPIFCSVAFVVTIHDLILTRFPSRRTSMLPASLYWLKQLAYRLIIKIAVKRARRVITVSEFTKDDIVKQLGVKADKIVVTYEGVANLSLGKTQTKQINVVAADILKKYNISKPYLLYVGNAYPHKNLIKFLEVFNHLRLQHSDISLVMVGKDDYFYQRVKQTAKKLNLWHKGAASSIVLFPGYVPDTDLEILYRHALLYVFPSLYEGFGLPPLEAMSQFCPVISSNQASLPEILGQAAAYFDPYDEKDMQTKISALMNDPDRRRELSLRGIEHVQAFDWYKCALETLVVYRQVLLNGK